MNIIYTIFNEKISDNFGNLDLMLLNSLEHNKSKIITLKSRRTEGYNLYLVGKTPSGYVIISSSIESLRQDANTTIVAIILETI